MKTIYLILTVFLGVVGVLAVLRSIERIVTGIGVLPTQLLIAMVFLLLAHKCYRKVWKSEKRVK